VLKEVFGEACSPVTLNFLYLLINQRREEFLGEIFTEYRSWIDQARGIQQAHVTLAEPVDEETEELIRKAVISLIDEKIRITISIDPDIIGGLVVRIGDRRYDASLRRQLERMKLALKARSDSGKG
jgi:F-type H+-transporting ATPase subunit delta